MTHLNLYGVSFFEMYTSYMDSQGVVHPAAVFSMFIVKALVLRPAVANGFLIFGVMAPFAMRC